MISSLTLKLFFLPNCFFGRHFTGSFTWWSGKLKPVSLPVDPSDPSKSTEKVILSSFMNAVGRLEPQLVGYNSAQADIPIIIQRAIVNGLPGLGFSERPSKPWRVLIISMPEIQNITSIWQMRWGNFAIGLLCIKRQL